MGQNLTPQGDTMKLLNPRTKSEAELTDILSELSEAQPEYEEVLMEAIMYIRRLENQAPTLSNKNIFDAITEKTRKEGYDHLSGEHLVAAMRADEHVMNDLVANCNPKIYDDFIGLMGCELRKVVRDTLTGKLFGGVADSPEDLMRMMFNQIKPQE